MRDQEKKALKEVYLVFKSLLREESQGQNSGCSPIFNLKQSRPSLREFLADMYVELELDVAHLITAVMYLDLIALKFQITRENIYYLIYVACTLALKYHDDAVFSDRDFAEIINVDFKLFVKMQVLFLEAIDYQLFVSEDVHREYRQNICSL